MNGTHQLRRNVSNYAARSRSIRVTDRNFCWRRRRSTPRLRAYATMRDIPRWRHYGRKWQITVVCIVDYGRSHGDVGCRCCNSASVRIRLHSVNLERAIRFPTAITTQYPGERFGVVITRDTFTHTFYTNSDVSMRVPLVGKRRENEIV